MKTATTTLEAVEQKKAELLEVVVNVSPSCCRQEEFKNDEEQQIFAVNSPQEQDLAPTTSGTTTSCKTTTTSEIGTWNDDTKICIKLTCRSVLLLLLHTPARVNFSSSSGVASINEFDYKQVSVVNII